MVRSEVTVTKPKSAARTPAGRSPDRAARRAGRNAPGSAKMSRAHRRSTNGTGNSRSKPARRGSAAAPGGRSASAGAFLRIEIPQDEAEAGSVPRRGGGVHQRRHAKDRHRKARERSAPARLRTGVALPVDGRVEATAGEASGLPASSSSRKGRDAAIRPESRAVMAVPHRTGSEAMSKPRASALGGSM